MKPPKHICDLNEYGKTMRDLESFRFQLQAFRITLCWNLRRHEWTFGKVPRTGPTFLALHVGVKALIEIMDAGAGEIGRRFEEMEAELAGAK